MSELLRPGQIVPKSGQYEVVGPQGGKREGLEITLVEGKPVPPVQKGQRLKLVDKTKHKQR